MTKQNKTAQFLTNIVTGFGKAKLAERLHATADRRQADADRLLQLNGEPLAMVESDEGVTINLSAGSYLQLFPTAKPTAGQGGAVVFPSQPAGTYERKIAAVPERKNAEGTVTQAAIPATVEETPVFVAAQWDLAAVEADEAPAS